MKGRFFFFEKKKQKTFECLRCVSARAAADTQISKSLFASFSSEKEDSFFCLRMRESRP
jgi:hypothetical protein